MHELSETILRVLGTAWQEARRVAHKQNSAFIGFTTIVPEVHIGDQALPVDGHVHEHISRDLKAAIPAIFAVIGEEAWQTLCVPPEGFVAVVDAIDGTKPFTHLTAAWSIVVLLMQQEEGKPWALPVVATVNSTGIFNVLQFESEVFSGHIDDIEHCDRCTECATRCDADALSISIVAASKKDREERLLPLHERSPSPSVIFNVGGNPVVHGVVQGRLDAIVSMHAQSIWDSAYALIVSRAGGSVGDLDGNTVNHNALLDSFRHLSQPTDKPIAPLIAAKDAVTYERVYSEYFKKSS